MSVVRRKTMGSALRSLAVCVGLCLTCLGTASPAAWAEVSASHGRSRGGVARCGVSVARARQARAQGRSGLRGRRAAGLRCGAGKAAGVRGVGGFVAGGSGSSLLVVPFVVPGSPTEGEELRAQEEVERSSPEAVAEREASRTKFEGLDPEQAEGVAVEAFPGVINRLGGGPPPLGVGQKLTGFAAADVARVDLGEGRHGVIESMEPMAIEGSSGHFTPIDLGLSEAGAVFEPSHPLVEVQLPKRLGDGAQLPQIGVSLTPVDAQGDPLGGSEGSLDGASVFYANTQTDSDTVLKPTTAGVEADTVLRSVESPQGLYFRVGLPEGASLVQAQGGSGAVEVIDEGAVVALIASPGATDAAGTPVPVSMSVDGDLVVVTVASHAGEYQWPISVDPELRHVEDKDLTRAVYPVKGERGTNWLPFGKIKEHFNFTQWYEGEATQYWIIKPNTNYVEKEEAGVQYETQGESWIYKFEAGTYSQNYNTGTVSTLELVSHGGAVEKEERLSSNNNVNKPESTLCPGTCEPEAPTEAKKGNIARFKATTTTSGTTFLDEIYRSDVYVAQEKEPEVHFNTESPTIDGGRANVMYGSGAWLSPSSGAFELRSRDPGIGVSRAAVSGDGFSQEFPFYKEDKCLGIQCNEEFNQPIVYNAGMGNGEKTFELYVEDAAGLYGYVEKKVKVYGAPPHSLEVSGWPASREVSAGPHALTIAATDGEKPEPSPGVRSIFVSIDGASGSLVPKAACVPGPGGSGECKAKGPWTLDAEAFERRCASSGCVRDGLRWECWAEGIHVRCAARESCGGGPGLGRSDDRPVQVGRDRCVVEWCRRGLACVRVARFDRRCQWAAWSPVGNQSWQRPELDGAAVGQRGAGRFRGWNDHVYAQRKRRIRITARRRKPEGRSEGRKSRWGYQRILAEGLQGRCYDDVQTASRHRRHDPSVHGSVRCRRDCS